MTADDLNQLIATLETKYPPLITPEQAAEIAAVPLGTIYAWSSASSGGRLDSCKVKVGRHVRFGLACFARTMFGSSCQCN